MIDIIRKIKLNIIMALLLLGLGLGACGKTDNEGANEQVEDDTQAKSSNKIPSSNGSTSAQESVIGLSGLDFESATGRGFDFEQVDIETGSDSKMLIISNEGQDTITNCLEAVISGESAEEFTITEDSCGTSDLEAGSQCEIKLKSVPIEAGLKVAVFTKICSYLGNETKTELKLRAQGVRTLEKRLVITPRDELATSEIGKSIDVSIHLDSAPKANVTLKISSGDLTEGTVSTASLEFTPLNFDQDQIFTITGVDDDRSDGDIAYTVAIQATSEDDYYNLETSLELIAINKDDDVIGINFSKTTQVVTTEGLGTDSFLVSLTSIPDAAVKISFTSSDTSEGIVTPSSLTFEPDTWNVLQTVTITGVDDDIIDGDLSYTIKPSISSEDKRFEQLNVSDIEAKNNDNDVASVLGVEFASSTSLQTSETGQTDSFNVTLSSRPKDDVTFSLTSSDTSEGTVSPASIIFSPDNWDVSQLVTVTGIDDDFNDGDIEYLIITSNINSNDKDYNGMALVNIGVINSDDEVPGVELSSTTGLVTTEGGDSDSFSIILKTQPAANVEIYLASSNLAEGSVEPASLTITPETWDTQQVIIVTGVDDDVDDGAINYNIITSNTISNDPNYNNIDVENVSVTNNDDDTSGITLTDTTGLTTSEDGTTDTFAIVLDSEPTANVSINLESSNTQEGTVSPSSVTFTPANWNTAQTITVTGVNDYIDDSNTEYSIITSTAISSDSNYSGLDVTDTLVTNTDDDTFGITMSEVAGLSTTESSGSDTFTVVLNSQPTADVTFSLQSSDLSEGSVNPTTLTFTSADWNTEKSVTIIGVNDDLDDGDISYSIITSDVSSTDSSYSGMSVSDVSATNTDDDDAGITLSQTSGLVTSEDGITDSFTVVLTSEPTANVTISLSSSDTSEGTVSPANLTFTSSNWSSAQTITVSGEDDYVDDDDIAYSIVTSDSTSTDSNYNGVSISDVSVTNIDDDTANISVFPTSGLIVSEAGSTATFEVVLTSEPLAGVTVGLSSTDTTEGTVNPSSVLFSTSNWYNSQTVTVTGVDDTEVDGSVNYQITTGTASSTDGNYNGMDSPDVSVTTSDDDTAAAITVSEISSRCDETGSQATFTIVLAAPPTDTVTIPGIASSDTGEGTVSPSSMSFTTSNWAEPQTVTITGVDDELEDGDQQFIILIDPVLSNDPDYDYIDPSNPILTNYDDDSFGVVVSVSGDETNEEGGSVDIDVSLKSPPTDDVEITLTSTDDGEGSFPGSVGTWLFTFTSSDWSTVQTVTLTGEDDILVDGDQAYQVTFAATSNDSNYDGIVVPNESLINLDDESVGFVVSAASNNTAEPDTTATFTIKLTTAPTESNIVTINLSSSDINEGTVSPTSVVFTTSNWSTPQTITITGVDDNKQDGNQSYSIITDPAISGDSRYNGLNPANVDLVNVDNDTVGIYVTESAINVSEDGTQGSFTVNLTSQPTDEVTISLSSNDTDEATVSPESLVFTSLNWSSAQTVNITGVDDAISDGTQMTQIVIPPAVSNDTNYNGIDPNDITVNNYDNDSPGISVLPLESLTVAESGTQDSFTINLNTAPTDDVVFNISNPDSSEINIAPTTLTFTTENWNVAQSVLVTGVDDSEEDSTIEVTIVLDAPSSNDSTYSSINPRDITVYVTDDDTIGYVIVSNDYGGSAIPTVEDGGEETFTMALKSPPTDDVTITLYSDNTAEGTVNPSTLTYTPQNWNISQTVTLRGVDDLEVQDGPIAYAIKFNNASSNDADYDGTKPVSDVAAVNYDDDGHEFIIIPYQGSLSVSELGAQSSFQMRLGKKPSKDVSIDLYSDDTSEGISSPSNLTFTKINYQSFQIVTITGVDDTLTDGNVNFNIVFEDAISQDNHYDSLKPDNISVLNYDNE